MKFVTIVLKRHEAGMNFTTPPAAEHPQMPPTLRRKIKIKCQREMNQQLQQVARKLEKVLKKQKMSNGDADNAVDRADNAVDRADNAVDRADNAVDQDNAVDLGDEDNVALIAVAMVVMPP